jgi:hypothetical protein
MFDPAEGGMAKTRADAERLFQMGIARLKKRRMPPCNSREAVEPRGKAFPLVIIKTLRVKVPEALEEI